MNRWRSLTFFVLIALPLAVVGWLGVRVARTEQDAMRARLREALERRLADVDADIAAVVASWRVDAQRVFGPKPPEALREALRNDGRFDFAFVMDAAGEVVFPPYRGGISAAERAFLLRHEALLEDKAGAMFRPPPEPRPAAQQQQVSQVRQLSLFSRSRSAPRIPSPLAAPPSDAPASPGRGWHVRHWDRGLNLVCWWREDGFVVGVECNTVRLKAEIAGALPTDNAAAERLALIDAQGAALYQWGAYTPGEGEAPAASLALSPPLHAWRLDYWQPGGLLGGPPRSAVFNVIAGLAALAVLTGALAVSFYRGYARDLREAAQRVSFVSQVSHELKTPLTNIRMYAELLDEELDAETPRKHLAIIVAESRRLSRLIGNVLTFNRKQRSVLTLHAEPGVPDDALRAVLDQFATVFAAKGAAVHFDAGAPERVVFDADALQQIVGNLLSNAEKYAAGARRVELVSRYEAPWLRIQVCDDGPGIPMRARKRVFEPFYRVSDKVTDGVAGTGIGLAIVRELAELHGGGAVLRSTDSGACFEVRLRAPRA